MKIVIEPSITLIYVASMMILLSLLIYKVITQKLTGGFQLNNQLFLFFLILGYLIFFIFIMKRAFFKQLLEYDTYLNYTYLKILQNLLEFSLKGILILGFNFILLILYRLDCKNFMGIKITRYTAYCYFFLRIYCVYIIIGNIKINYNMSIIQNEFFSIAESFLLILSFMFLYDTIIKVWGDLDENYQIAERFALEILFQKLKKIVIYFIIGCFLEIIYRIQFLCLAGNTNKKHYLLLMLKDISMIIRIISINTILYNLIELMTLPIVLSKNLMKAIGQILRESKNQNLIDEMYVNNDSSIGNLSEEGSFDDTTDNLTLLTSDGIFL